MSDVNQKDTGIAPVQQKSQRRSFLKRSAAGVVITSLPAQSVWGSVCTVSGAMSGNLSGIQRHADCEKPILSGGRSPGTWKNLVELHSGKVHAVFTNGVPNKSGKVNGTPVDDAEKIRACVMQGVQDVAMNSTMLVDSHLIDGFFETNVYDALTKDTGGLDYNMAAVWMNTYFGLYSPTYEASEHAANSLVEQLLAYIMVQANAGVAVEANDTFFNFGSGSTDYKFDSCFIAPFTP